MKSLENVAREQEGYVVELRRALHSHPKTRYETIFWKGVLFWAILATH